MIDPRGLGRCLAAAMLVLAAAAHAGEPDEGTETEPGSDAPAADGTTAESAAPAGGDSEGTKEEEQDEAELEEHVVVTANRTAQDERDIPANVTVLTQEEIEMTPARTVDDVLRQIPGFSLTRASSSLVASVGTAPAVLRGIGGSSSSRTLVLLDGVPMNDPYGGYVYWTRVPKDSVSRVEVVRGAGSNVWGNLAMAGVINIFTAPPTSKTLHVNAMAGTSDTMNLNLFASDVLGPVAVSVSGDYYDSDGYVVWRPEDRGLVDEPTHKKFETFTTKIETPISTRSSFFFTGSYFSEDHAKGTAFRDEYTDILSFVAGVDLRTEGESNWNLNVWTNDKGSEKWDSSIARDHSSETLSEYTEQPAFALGTSAVWSKRLSENNELTSGVDWQWIDTDYNENTVIVDDEFTRRRQIPGKQQLGGIFLQDIFHVSPRWQLTAAGRYDYFQNYDASEFITDSTGVVRDVRFEDHSETTFNPSVGVVFHATPSVSWRAAAYRGFRAPNADELYRGGVSRGVVIAPNPELDAEHLVGVESGMNFARPKFGGQVTLFWNQLRDRISSAKIAEAGPEGGIIEPCGVVEPDGICRIRANIGETTYRGIEVDLGYHPFLFWDFSLSYLYEHAEFTDSPDNPALVGLVPRQVPENMFTASVGYANERLFSASLQGRYVGERFEDDNNELPVNDFFALDVMLSKNLNEVVGIYASAENLLDEVIEVRLTNAGEVEIGTPRFVSFGIRLGF
jgi:outer membrane receptor protein involved in Fe transport